MALLPFNYAADKILTKPNICKINNGENVSKLNLFMKTKTKLKYEKD